MGSLLCFELLALFDPTKVHGLTTRSEDVHLAGRVDFLSYSSVITYLILYNVAQIKHVPYILVFSARVTSLNCEVPHEF